MAGPTTDAGHWWGGESPIPHLPSWQLMTRAPGVPNHAGVSALVSDPAGIFSIDERVFLAASCQSGHPDGFASQIFSKKEPR